MWKSVGDVKGVLWYSRDIWVFKFYNDTCSSYNNNDSCNMIVVVIVVIILIIVAMIVTKKGRMT